MIAAQNFLSEKCACNWDEKVVVFCQSNNVKTIQFDKLKQSVFKLMLKDNLIQSLPQYAAWPTSLFSLALSLNKLERIEAYTFSESKDLARL